MSKSRGRDTNGINDNKDKIENSAVFLKLETNRAVGWKGGKRWIFEGFSERGSAFSLKSPAIRPSEFFGTRRKVALRGEAYAWALILRSFDKLHEVGVSSFLVLHYV